MIFNMGIKLWGARNSICHGPKELWQEMEQETVDNILKEFKRMLDEEMGLL